VRTLLSAKYPGWRKSQLGLDVLQSGAFRRNELHRSIRGKKRMSKHGHLWILGVFVLFAPASYADMPANAWRDCTQNLAYNKTDWDGIIRGCTQVLESGATGSWRTEAFRQRAIAYEHKGEYDRARADRDAIAPGVPSPQPAARCTDWLRQQALPQLGCSPMDIEQICAGLRPVPTTSNCGSTYQQQPTSPIANSCESGCDTKQKNCMSACQAQHDFYRCFSDCGEVKTACMRECPM
jgi:hypothetical protein